MGQKTVRFSDLSGEIISRDDAVARIVVHEHPGLGDGPVEIEALTTTPGRSRRPACGWPWSTCTSRTTRSRTG